MKSKALVNYHSCSYLYRWCAPRKTALVVLGVFMLMIGAVWVAPLPKAWAGGVWKTVGMPGFSPGPANHLNLALDGATPYVAFQDRSNESRATVVRLEGDTWVPVGEAGFSEGAAYDLTLMMDGATPYLAYRDGAHESRVTVMRFDGTTWVPIGTPGFSGERVYNLTMTLNGSTPYVAFQDQANKSKATVMMFDGTTWVTVGAPGLSEGAVSYLSLAVDAATATPYVAYRDYAAGLRATVMRFDGTAWLPVGEAGLSEGSAHEITLKLAGATPYVAYRDEANGARATVMRFDGTTWLPVGKTGFSEGSAHEITLTLAGATPYVAYRDGLGDKRATVMRFDGTAWLPVGDVGFSHGKVNYLNLALDGTTPYVAYWHAGQMPQAVVMRTEGGKWVQVGEGIFSHGFAEYLTLALDGATPYVAYRDESHNARATLMRYDGTAWKPIGMPGFSDGAVYEVSLALDGATPYVAYRDDAHGAHATVMMFDGTTWVPVGEPGFSEDAAYEVSLALDGATPYLAYSDDAHERRATVMMFDGTTWVTVGTPGFSEGMAGNFTLVLDGATPYVAYRDKARDEHATVMMFDGTTWVPIGTPGFSADPVEYLDMALHGATPYLAYRSSAEGNQIKVLRFSGERWELIGNPGASAGYAYDLSLALDGATPYLAYGDGANGARATVVRFDGSEWKTLGSPGFSASYLNKLSLALDDDFIPYVAYQDGEYGFSATVQTFEFAASLTIVSEATPESDTTPFTFTSNISGADRFTLIDDGTNMRHSITYKVDPATYQVTAEELPAGWDLTDASCNNGDTPDAVTVDRGEDVVCTFTTTQRPATLTIVKDTVPDSDTAFSFTSSSAELKSFTLIDNGSGISNTLSQQVPAGTYTITEELTSGWGLTSATCDNGDAPNSVTIAPDEAVTCTFVNEAVNTTRVTDGVQVLYTFFEGSGTTVHDVSGVGIPLNLEIADPDQVHWHSDDILSVEGTTIIESLEPATKVINGVQDSNEITLEAWIQTDNLQQDGPARIVTISANPYERNTTLGYEDVYDVRLRTTRTSQNGIPSTSTPDMVTTDLTHVVYTRNSEGAVTLYLDAVAVHEGTIEGDLSNWNDSYHLALANEFTRNRNWQGDYHLVAIYNRALSPAEVEQNYEVGTVLPPPEPNTITVVNDTVPDDSQPFTYISNISGSEQFTLVDDGRDETRMTTLSVWPGTYTIEALREIGWLVSATCDNGDTPDAITVTMGEDVVCTFIQEKTTGKRVTSDLEVLYTFQEGNGTTVHDTSNNGEPLNLEIANPDHVTWLEDGGLSINASTIIESLAPASGLSRAAKSANELTIEAWVRPANTTQHGPARIVTLSEDPYARNFTLAQGYVGLEASDFYDVRLRTTRRTMNGRPSITSPHGSLTGNLDHVIYTHNSEGEAVIYVNGEIVREEKVDGSLASWNDSYHLALANEFEKERTWLGDYYLVAIYTRALSQEEVEQNRQAAYPPAKIELAVSTATPTEEPLPTATPTEEPAPTATPTEEPAPTATPTEEPEAPLYYPVPGEGEEPAPTATPTEESEPVYPSP